MNNHKKINFKLAICDANHSIIDNDLTYKNQ